MIDYLSYVNTFRTVTMSVDNKLIETLVPYSLGNPKHLLQYTPPYVQFLRTIMSRTDLLENWQLAFKAPINNTDCPNNNIPQFPSDNFQNNDTTQLPFLHQIKQNIYVHKDTICNARETMLIEAQEIEEAETQILTVERAEQDFIKSYLNKSLPGADKEDETYSLMLGELMYTPSTSIKFLYATLMLLYFARNLSIVYNQYIDSKFVTLLVANYDVLLAINGDYTSVNSDAFYTSGLEQLKKVKEYIVILTDKVKVETQEVTMNVDDKDITFLDEI